LMREATLISDAQRALRRPDPEAALDHLEEVRRGGSHKMVPEELSVRAHALRVLGRDAEAAAVEGTLKAKYPEWAH
jgi:hypothetical protein